MTASTQRIRATLPAALLLAMLFGRQGDAAAAEASAECCLRGTSAAMAQVNAAGVDSDEQFFTSKAAPPNLMFLLDNSGSMNALPFDPDVITKTQRGNGCQSAVVDALLLAGGFDMSKSYPPPDLGVAPPGSPLEWNGDSGFPDLYRENSYYRYWQSNSSGWVDNRPAAMTARDACYNTSNRSQCEQCVTTKGYYLDPNNITTRDRQIFSGKFLNYYPPKFVTARLVLKKVIWNLRSVRFGVVTFRSNEGGTLVSNVNPTCEKALAVDDPSDDSAGSWTNNRKSRINEINGIKFDQSTPLAETLLNIGQYFSADNSVFQNAFGSGWTINEFKNGSLNSGNRSICWACQVSSTVIITDGAPSNDNCVPKAISDLDVDCSGCNQNDGTCSGSCPSTCGSNGRSSCCANDKNRLDDVAKWLATTDLYPGQSGYEGRQRMTTYTVGFGFEHPLLVNTAAAGEGKYYHANDRESLEAALLDAIADINRRATSFGVSSIATLQTSTEGSSTTLVPRFIPGAETELWRGSLSRFDLANEFINGCEPTPLDQPAHPKDLDGDHRCVSMLYQDRDGHLVEEDANTGAFVKKGIGTPAKPIWEAGRELTYETPTYDDPETAPLRNTDTRSIWTVIDDKAPFGAIDAKDTMLEFTAANAVKLMPYMQISPDIRLDPICTALAASMGIEDSPSVRSNWGSKCAETIIEYYRGRRANDPDPAKRTLTRPWLLGDIFHSSPVVVEPPVAPEACAYFRHQCVTSLFRHGGDPAGTTTSQAYRDYVTSNSGPCGGIPCEKRSKIVLVGANDGFLHAFDYGEPKSSNTREKLTQRLDYTNGTGKELWAFIPPDLLGSLKHSINKHAYFVDGTALVRDIWVDGDELNSGDGIKQASEFKTVAIVGERTGGVHFFALDVTNAATQPKFLWLWPQPCDRLADHVGQSWSNILPKPPPIVPVLLDTDTTQHPKPFKFKHRDISSDTGDWVDLETNAQERWVVMLNGGFDKYLQRGRGVAMVDAWTGRTLWDAFFDPDADDLRSKLEYPVPAGVAMMDIGSGEPNTPSYEPSDGYFDIGNFGDMGGNLWTARFYAPGRIDTATGKVNNWPLARSFQTELADGDLKRRKPITFITSNILEPNGSLRTFFGTGDRNAILASGGGECTPDNLPTCIAMGCTVDVQYRTTRNGEELRMRTKWKDAKVESSIVDKPGCLAWSCYDPCETNCRTYCNDQGCSRDAGANEEACLKGCETSCAMSVCADGCSREQLKLKVSVKGCPSGTTAGDDSFKRDLSFVCAQGAGVLSCGLNKYANDSGRRTWKSTTDLTRSKYYGVHSYGGKPGMAFSDQAGASEYDDRRLTETGLKHVGTMSTTTPQPASEGGPGWYITYDHVDEKTATAAAVSAGGPMNDRGCVIWNTLTPTQGAGASVCATTGAQSARLAQADYLTGMPNCAAGWEGNRFQTRSVLVPPVEPTAVMMLSSGRLTHGVASPDPGKSPSVSVTGVETDLVQPLYSLELNEQEHLCRHVHGGDACAP